MTKLFVLRDGHQVDADSDSTNHLINDDSRWGKLKRNRYKLLMIALTVVVLVTCVVALAVTLTGSSSIEQSSSATKAQINHEEQNSELNANFNRKMKQRGRKPLNEHRNSNEGTHFAIAFPSVYSFTSTSYYECFITTRDSTTVEFESPYLGLDKSVFISAGGIHTEAFSDTIKTTGGKENKAIYITADSPIIVQCAARYMTHWDAFLALPFNEYDREYYIAVCDDFSGTSSVPVGFVNVVATVDGTKLNITCPTGLPECPTKNYIIDLDYNQTYSLYVNRYSDLTGFYVKASKPVSVNTGSPYLRLYEGGSYTFPQITVFAVPPLQQLGTRHYTPETTGDAARNHRLRIVATTTTRVTIPQYGVNETLQRSEFLTQDYPSSDRSLGPVEVGCTSPCLVIHCNKEHQPDTYHVFMMRITPVEGYTDDIVFSAASYYDYTLNHYLSIVVDQYPVTDIYLDGDLLPDDEWIPNESGDHAGIMISVSDDIHHLWTTNEGVKFSAYIHGNKGSDNDYGYGSQAGVGDATYDYYDPREAPDYRVQVWGEFTSLDGEDFSMECGAGYADELSSKADSMMSILNDHLGNLLCGNLTEEDIKVITNINSLTTSGPEGQTWVAFVMDVDKKLSFEEVHDCGGEVTTYLLDHANWGTPLLPPIDGCPFAVFNPPIFYDDGSEWICSDTMHDKQYAATPAVPGYDITMDSNFTTFSGEDLSTECGADYMEELGRQTAVMFDELNSRMGISICQGTTFFIVSHNSVFYYLGKEGLATVTFVLQGEEVHQIEEVFECTDDILPFVLDHVNWGGTLLPQLPGCPFLVFHQQRFYEKEQNWNCDISSQAELV